MSRGSVVGIVALLVGCSNAFDAQTAVVDSGAVAVAGSGGAEVDATAAHRGGSGSVSGAGGAETTGGSAGVSTGGLEATGGEPETGTGGAVVAATDSGLGGTSPEAGAGGPGGTEPDADPPPLVCQGGYKTCPLAPDTCWLKQPNNGCGDPECNPCPYPGDHEVSLCRLSECAHACADGYARNVDGFCTAMCSPTQLSCSNGSTGACVDKPACEEPCCIDTQTAGCWNPETLECVP